MNAYEFMEKLENISYDEVEYIAKKTLFNISKNFSKSVADYERPLELLFDIIGSMIATDGIIRENEQRLFIDIFGNKYSEDKIYDIVRKRSNDSVKEAVDNFIDSVKDEVSADAKNDYEILMMCFACVDGRLSKEELEYIAKIFE